VVRLQFVIDTRVELSTDVEISLDAARTSACATVTI
jgi:hypothetical protein